MRATMQYDGLGEYCGLSTASEVFLIFTTPLYSYLCNYPAICFIYLQEGSIATGIFPTPNTSLSSLPGDSKDILTLTFPKNELDSRFSPQNSIIEHHGYYSGSSLAFRTNNATLFLSTFICILKSMQLIITAGQCYKCLFKCWSTCIHWMTWTRRLILRHS